MVFIEVRDILDVFHVFVNFISDEVSFVAGLVGDYFVSYYVENLG